MPQSYIYYSVLHFYALKMYHVYHYDETEANKTQTGFKKTRHVTNSSVATVDNGSFDNSEIQVSSS